MKSLMLSFERTAEIVKKDFLAYEIFKEISRLELNTEIWPIALSYVIIAYL
jgi:hypothetical protein